MASLLQSTHADMSPSPKLSPKRVRLPYPTEDVSNDVIKSLQFFLDRDAEAEARQAEVEAKADSIRRERAGFQEKIFFCRAIIARVRMLPVAVLEKIFALVVAASPDALPRLGAVCRLWRAVAKYPPLWSNVVLTAEGFLAQKKAELFLRRSDKVPLDITYIQSSPHEMTLPDTFEMTWPAWNTLVSSVDRWRSLSLEFFDCRAASSRVRALGPALNLVELSISIRRQCADPDDEGEFLETFLYRGRDEFAEGLPLLRTLYLSTFILPVEPGNIFRQLTKLHICDTFAQLESPNLIPMLAPHVLNLLLSCPNLEDFSFNAEGSCHWHVLAKEYLPVEGPMIHLSHLRRLHLNCHFYTAQCMLNFITAEVLDSASLLLRPRHATNTNDVAMSTIQFIHRSPKLRSLHILGLHRGVTLAVTITGCPHLEELHLEYTTDLDAILDRFAVELPIKDGETCWYAPRLSRLIIDATPSDFSEEKLAKLVKARFLANRNRLISSSIEKLIVNKRDMLEGMPPGEMAEFEHKQQFCDSP